MDRLSQAGGRITRRVESLAEAEASAQDLANEFGRPSLVYAINAAGRSALAAAMQPKRRPT